MSRITDRQKQNACGGCGGCLECLRVERSATTEELAEFNEELALDNFQYHYPINGLCCR